MTGIRIWTGSLLILLTYICLAIGGFLFSLSVGIIAIITLWEFYKLVICNITNIYNLLLCLLGLLNSYAIVLLAHMSGTIHIPLIILFNLIITSFLSIIAFKDNNKIPLLVIKQNVGLIYIPLPLSLLVIIRNGENGFLWSLMILSIIAAGDTGAYFFGKLLGRKKLCKHVSPKKTIEGSLSGLICSFGVVLIFKFYLFNYMSILYCILFACLLSLIGQIGDLFASELKRLSGVKDSGKLLPGHGGFLDRIDAILLALPVAYTFYIII